MKIYKDFHKIQLEIYFYHIKSNIYNNIYYRYLTFEFKKLGLPIIRGAFEISCSFLGSI